MSANSLSIGHKATYAQGFTLVDCKVASKANANISDFLYSHKIPRKRVVKSKKNPGRWAVIVSQIGTIKATLFRTLLHQNSFPTRCFREKPAPA